MLERIKEVSLFKNLKEEEIKGFLPIIKERNFEPEQRIFKEGDLGNSLFIIEKGAIEIRKQIDPSSDREKTLATIRAGSFFGEMAMYSDSASRRSASSYAIGTTSCFEIDAQDYHALIKANPHLSSSLSRAIIITLSERLRNTSRELVVLYETGKIIGTIKDADQLCEALIKHLKDSLKAEVALIAIHNPYADRIDVKSTLGFDSRVLELEIQQNIGTLGKCFAQGTPVVAEGFASDDVELKALLIPGFEIKSLLCVPLLKETQTVGLILLADTTSNYYTDSEINLMLGVSRQVATAIENAYFHLEEKARKEYRKQYITPEF
ncbi:MAG: cyclic nucleotide-binding domain-containing protein [Candidatus Wallbacteria bacterium]|nr:cyclic nucleotide-binding domain-containing protein [Candidatus Wallbacteria bacterium]